MLASKGWKYPDDNRSYLLRVDDVHNHTTLQHLSQAGLHSEAVGGGGAIGTVGSHSVYLEGNGGTKRSERMSIEIDTRHSRKERWGGSPSKTQFLRRPKTGPVSVSQDNY